MDFVPREAIQLLVNTAQREAFPHEREVRLCQFQTWVYFPERSPDWVSMAGSLMAVKYLNNLERGLLRARKSRTRPTSRTLPTPTPLPQTPLDRPLRCDGCF
jgi:hypothetical protein